MISRRVGVWALIINANAIKDTAEQFITFKSIVEFYEPLTGPVGNHLMVPAGADGTVRDLSGILRSDGSYVIVSKVAGFTRGADKIDLSRIDIMPSGSRDYFTVAGEQVFHPVARQLIDTTAASQTNSPGDADGKTDLGVLLDGVFTLRPDDFIIPDDITGFGGL